LKSKGWRSALVLLVLGAAVAAIVFGVTSRHEAKGERVEAGQGIVRESSSGEQSRERARAAASAAQATLGPHVGTGEFQGMSTAVGGSARRRCSARHKAEHP